MIFLSFRTVEKQKYRIQAEKGEELLKTLDKFLKKNKIKIASIKNWYIDFLKKKVLLHKEYHNLFYTP